MTLRRQTNVSLTPEMAEVMERFARVFHRGEFAPVARLLIEEGLRHIRTKEDYLAALDRETEPDVNKAGLPAPPEIETQLQIEDDLRRKHGLPEHTKDSRKRKNN